MDRIIAVAVAAALTALSAGGTRAQETEVTGNFLYDLCRNYEAGSKSDKAGFSLACMAFIAGVVQAHKLLTDENPKSIYMSCPPTNGSGEQFRDVVLKYLQAHPAERHLPGAGIVLFSLQDAFPCGKRR